MHFLKIYSTLSIGLAVHTESLAVAYVAPEHHAAVVSLGTIGPRPCDIAHRMCQMPSTSKPLLLVSEAGPCGYWLSRSLTQKGQVCWVVAPSLLPKKPGNRVKTNRRDALKLARLRRAGPHPSRRAPGGGGSDAGPVPGA